MTEATTNPVAMTPQQAAHETRTAIVATTSGPWTDPATYAHGESLGFEGQDFYVAGRGGVLGDTHADVVVAAFVFFSADAIRPRWDRSAAVMSRDRAAQEWAGRGHAWTREHLDADVDWSRLVELLGRIVAAAPVAGAPLFAGWRLLAEPEDAKALAWHRMNALRELRGGLHGAAVLTVGLSPHEALSVLTPKMISLFGWSEPALEPGPLQERWSLAEARTDRMLGRHFGVLDETERKELVELLGALAS